MIPSRGRTCQPVTRPHLSHSLLDPKSTCRVSKPLPHEGKVFKIQAEAPGPLKHMPETAFSFFPSFLFKIQYTLAVTLYPFFHSLSFPVVFQQKYRETVPMSPCSDELSVCHVLFIDCLQVNETLKPLAPYG